MSLEEITPAELCAELSRRGRKVSRRALRDWHSVKGLIPKPRLLRGRGPRKGIKWGWDDPRIVDRSFLVSSLLAIHCEVDTALVALCLLGFDVDMNRLRDAWGSEQDDFDSQHARLKTKNPDDEVLAESVGTISRRKIGRLHGLKINQELVSNAAFLMLNPSQALEGEADFLVEDVAKESMPATFGIDPADAEKFDFSGVSELMQSIDLSAIKERVVPNASDEELGETIRLWTKLATGARLIVPEYFDRTASNPVPLGDQYLVQMGRIIVPNLIRRKRVGEQETLERKIDEVVAPMIANNGFAKSTYLDFQKLISGGAFLALILEMLGIESRQ
jgi:hypothetical protein